MLSTITASNAIQAHYAPGWYEAAYRYDKFLAAMRALGMVEETAPGGTNHSWHCNTLGGNPGIFTEGGALPDPVSQTWARLTLSWVYSATMIQVSGHAKDALRDGIFDAIEAEMQLAQRDLISLRDTTVMGASNNGIGMAVDSTTTYAGQTRGSAAWFESTESNTNTLAGIRAAFRATNDAEKGGNTGAIICSPTILQWYAATAGLPGTSNFIMGNSGGGPMNIDTGFAWTGQTFMGRPVIGIPGITSSEMYGLDFSAGNIKYKTIRSLGVEFHHKSGDSDVLEVSTGGTFVVQMPKWQFKMTGLS